MRRENESMLCDAPKDILSILDRMSVRFAGSSLTGGTRRQRGMAPNKRLKLAAPVPNGSGCRPELRCGRFSFVIISARRRSLSAIR